MPKHKNTHNNFPATRGRGRNEPVYVSDAELERMKAEFFARGGEVEPWWSMNKPVDVVEPTVKSKKSRAAGAE